MSELELTLKSFEDDSKFASLKLDKPKRVLVAVENDEQSHRCLKWALKNFIRPGDKVEILHIFSYDPPIEFNRIGGGVANMQFSLSTTPDFSEQHRVAAQRAIKNELGKYVIECKQVITDSGHVKLTVLKGDDSHTIGQLICAYANKLRTVPDTLITSTALEKTFNFDSVSEYCLKHCKCPVLVVKAEMVEQEAAKLGLSVKDKRKSC